MKKKCLQDVFEIFYLQLFNARLSTPPLFTVSFKQSQKSKHKYYQ